MGKGAGIKEPYKPMEAETVINVYRTLRDAGIPIWIDGGWGIDALLGRQTRPHEDLDIAVDHKHVDTLRAVLGTLGYTALVTPDMRDYNFVLQDAQGRRIDVHTFVFDAEGKHQYGIAYPLESLRGTGTIGDQTVPCIALEWVIRFHENYDPDEGDLKDIRALIDQFGIEMPRNYRGRL
jgi:lincosamide nucleotidyltransferase A/C/D/E